MTYTIKHFPRLRRNLTVICKIDLRVYVGLACVTSRCEVASMRCLARALPIGAVVGIAWHRALAVVRTIVVAAGALLGQMRGTTPRRV